jgi:hypothetical protein
MEVDRELLLLRSFMRPDMRIFFCFSLLFFFIFRSVLAAAAGPASLLRGGGPTTPRGDFDDEELPIIDFRRFMYAKSTYNLLTAVLLTCEQLAGREMSFARLVVTQPSYTWWQMAEVQGGTKWIDLEMLLIDF